MGRTLTYSCSQHSPSHELPGIGSDAGSSPQWCGEPTAGRGCLSDISLQIQFWWPDFGYCWCRPAGGRKQHHSVVKAQSRWLIKWIIKPYYNVSLDTKTRLWPCVPRQIVERLLVYSAAPLPVMRTHEKNMVEEVQAGSTGVLTTHSALYQKLQSTISRKFFSVITFHEFSSSF